MDVTSRLTEAGVNIRAVATFDTPEFGILRMVVDKPYEAKEYLTKLGYVVRIHEVMGVALEDKKGNLNQMLAILAKGELNINYIYRLLSGMAKNRLWCLIQMILRKQRKY